MSIILMIAVCLTIADTHVAYGQTTAQSICNNEGAGAYPNPDDNTCIQYARCTFSNGAMTGAFYNCTGTTLFNPSLQQCVVGYTCLQTTTTTTTASPTTTTTKKAKTTTTIPITTTETPTTTTTVSTTTTTTTSSPTTSTTASTTTTTTESTTTKEKKEKTSTTVTTTEIPTTTTTTTTTVSPTTTSTTTASPTTTTTTTVSPTTTTSTTVSPTTTTTTTGSPTTTTTESTTTKEKNDKTSTTTTTTEIPTTTTTVTTTTTTTVSPTTTTTTTGIPTTTTTESTTTKEKKEKTSTTTTTTEVPTTTTTVITTTTESPTTTKTSTTENPTTSTTETNLTVDCIYEISQGWKVVADSYGSLITTLNLKYKVNITTVIGTHLNGYTNIDVKVITVQGGICEIIPFGFGLIYPNIKAISVWNATLKTVSSEDLREFGNLKEIWFEANRLEYLYSTLFQYNPKVEYVKFSSNSIKFIGGSFFNFLPNLKSATFLDNVCINSDAKNAKKLDACKNEIQQNCSLSNATSVTVECEYEISQGWKVVADSYGSFITSLNLTYQVNVTGVVGPHLNGYKNSDVKVITIHGGICEIIPSGFGLIYPNIKAISVWNATLKTVSSEDLREFGNLKEIWFEANQLEYLYSTLFQYNPKVEYVKFSSNSIKFIGGSFFNFLPNLKSATFLDNVCINSDAKNAKKLDACKSEIKQNCSLSNATSVTVECEYEISQGWEVVADSYGSFITSLNLTYQVNVTGVVGPHLNGYKNIDVKVITVQGGICEIIPPGFGLIYPNIEAFSVWNATLKTVSSGDLQEFGNLKEIWFEANQLEYLDSTLFQYNPKVEYVKFSSNSIKYIGESFFNFLPNLKSATFLDNACINSDAKNANKLDACKNEIKQNCSLSNVTYVTDISYFGTFISIQDVETLHFIIAILRNDINTFEQGNVCTK